MGPRDSTGSHAPGHLAPSSGVSIDLVSFFRGAVIGLTVAAPLESVGILCIRRTLTQGFGVGIVSGLGAATVHAIYGTLALYGVAAVAAFVLTHRAWLLAIDIAVLGRLGYRIFRAAPQERSAPTGQGVAEPMSRRYR